MTNFLYLIVKFFSHQEGGGERNEYKNDWEAIERR